MFDPEKFGKFLMFILKLLFMVLGLCYLFFGYKNYFRLYKHFKVEAPRKERVQSDGAACATAHKFIKKELGRLSVEFPPYERMKFSPWQNVRKFGIEGQFYVVNTYADVAGTPEESARRFYYLELEDKGGGDWALLNMIMTGSQPSDAYICAKAKELYAEKMADLADGWDPISVEEFTCNSEPRRVMLKVMEYHQRASAKLKFEDGKIKNRGLDIKMRHDKKSGRWWIYEW